MGGKRIVWGTCLFRWWNSHSLSWDLLPPRRTSWGRLPRYLVVFRVPAQLLRVNAQAAWVAEGADHAVVPGLPRCPVPQDQFVAVQNVPVGVKADLPVEQPEIHLLRFLQELQKQSEGRLG